MNIKDSLKKFKNSIMLSEIWDDAKKCVAEVLNMGNVVEVLGKSKRKYETCPENFPSEYCSNSNIDVEFAVKTDNGKSLIIVQKYLGLNFEAPCDDTLFIIYNENREVLYDSSKEKDNNKQNKKIITD